MAELENIPPAPGIIGGVVLVDPVTRKPYTAQNIVQQTDGEFSTAGLASESKQDAQTATLEEIADALTTPLTVNVANQEHPLPNGAATSANQASILTALQGVASLLGNPLTVTIDGEPLEVTIPAQALPEGAATGAKQDATNAALGSLLQALQATLSVDGFVGIKPGQSVEVTGTVGLSNATLAVTPSGTFNVTVTGGATADKQDALLAAVGNLITAVQAPQPITDNGGSITVDGTVGVSGTVTVATHAVTQSGTWNVTATPANAGTLTTTPTAVSVGTTSVQLAASVAGRKSVVIQNMGGTELFLSFAGTASVTAPTMRVAANAWIVIDRDTWTGVITAIRNTGSATADAIVTVTS